MKGIKKQIGKIPKIALSLLMTLTCINFTGLKEAYAVELYNEATSSVSTLASNINIDELGSTDLYDITLDGSTAFCYDHGKSCRSGNKYARTGTVTNSQIRQVLNWYYGERTSNGYGEDFVYGMAQATIWAIQAGKMDDKSLASIYEDVLVHYSSSGAVGHGLAFVEIFYKGDGSDLNGKAILEYPTSGTYYIYSYGSNSHQRLVTKEPGVATSPRMNDVTSEKSYSTSESIKVKVNKTDVEEGTSLEGISFDFYQDGKKGGSAVTNANGVAEHTFKTEFSKTATSTKEYVVNYNDLSIPNQNKLSGYYTSKSAAQAAADKEALEKAKELALAGSNQEHTYKVVETATRTGYYLNTSNNTYEKKHTGDGTVTFNITNKRQVGSITITKQDSDTSNLVDGATYGLYARNPITHPDGKTGVLYQKDQLVATFEKTGTNGKATLNNLYLGDYYVKEISAPAGYVKSTDVYNVSLTYAGQNIEITDASTTVKDKVQRAEINGVKEDKELNNGSKDVNIFDGNKDGAQGDATRKNATYGLYALENITHADGTTGIVQYNSTDGSIHQLKATKGSNLQVKNTKATAGALLATIQTDANGEFGFSNLYNGKYYIKEIEPSEGYLLDTTQYNIDLSYTNENQEVVIKSQTVLEQVKKQAFDLVKVGHAPGTSTNARPLEGVEFSVWLESDIQRLMNTGLNLAEAKAKAPVYDKLVTNAEGKASSIELPYGHYRVGETKAAVDYATADDFFVTVSEDSREHQDFSNNIIIDEQFSALIKAVKQDKETGKQVALSDTEFKVKALTDVYVDGKKFNAGEYIGYWNSNIFDGFYTDSWKTNDDGYVIINEKLGAGEYQLEEIHAPYGYVLDTTPVKFKVTNQNQYQLTEDGTPLIIAYKQDISTKGKITVTKQGEVLVGYEDGQFIYETRGLPNMEANVYAKENIMDPSNDGTVLYKAGELVESLTTDSTGKATTKELPLGKYTVKEIKAPHGYVINKTEYDVELKYKDENTELVFESVGYENDRQKVDLSLYKKNVEQTTMLSGGEFDIIANQDIQNVDGDVIVSQGTILDHIVTDTNGYARTDLDLPLDTNFAFVETKAPVGYILNETPIPFVTEYEGQDYHEINVAKEALNEETKVIVSKIDMTTSEELPGNTMKIFEKDNEGSTFITWISSDKPQEIKNLDVNTRYILRETSAAKGFYLAQDIEFELDEYGNLYVVNEDGQLVKAEENKLVMENDLVKGRLEWNKQGEIFTHTDTGQTEFGKVETPVWEESNLLQSEITIYAAEDITLGNGITYYEKDEEIQTLESDWNAVQSQDLLVGKYYYVESKVPHGYVVDTDKHYFEVKDNQSSKLQIVSSTLENNRPTVEIDFTKFMERFEHHNKVDDAYKDVVFGIYAREDIYDYMGGVAIENGTMVGTSGIDELGHLTSVPDLPNGVYYLKELQTDEDYVLDGNEYDFEIAYHGSDVSSYTVIIGNGTVENELIRGSIAIQKNDSFDFEKKLKDVEFNISANQDMSEIISTEKTDENGIARFEDMEIGKYYIQEAKQVNGYTYNDHIYEVEITTDGELLTINVDNKPTEMQFSKVDETGTNELPGAEVEVIDKETGEVVDRWTSTKEKHTIQYLIEGKEYIFRETSAPYGYEIAEEITFIAGDGKTVTMKDELILTDIQVNKVDSQTMKAIVSKDFEFTMYSDDACQNVITKVNANTEDGTATFKDMPYGTYYIKETKAPLGYELSTEVKKVVINENTEGVGDIYSFVYLNTLMPAKKTETVKTGDNQNATLYAGLLLGAGIAIAGLSFKKKKGKKNKEK